MKKAWLLTCSLAACNGTETGNPPVIDFGNSGCHDQAYDKGILQRLDQPDARYKGLTCLAFSHDATTMRVTLSNYESGCHSDDGWRPRTEIREDGGLDIVLQDSNCDQASCGWCIYDLSFEIELPEPLGAGEVRVYQRGCESAPHQKRATLELSQPSGVACDYAHSVALDDRNGDPGGLRTMCGAIGSRPANACQDGLSCTNLGARAPGDFSGGERCLATCQADADCDALSRCVDTICTLSATGLKSD